MKIFRMLHVAQIYKCFWFPILLPTSHSIKHDEREIQYQAFKLSEVQKSITMRFTLINTLTLGLLTLAPGVLGDFHVAVSLFYSTYSSVGLVTSLGACPSNYFNCDCFQNSDRFAYGIGTDGDVSAPSFFSVEDLCGVSQVNFYQQGSASTYVSILQKILISEIAESHGTD